MASIKVAVRIRPISTREIKITGSELVVHTETQKISLINPKVPSSRTADSRKRIKQFSFDHCFDSSDPNADDYAGQEQIYEVLGVPVLDSFLVGYNASIVAYGQSASGKSYTMMGTNDDPGLIPRICNDLFQRASQEEKNGKVFRFFVSYLEIYNEKVRDLLNTSTNSTSLRIREHPRFGPYVEGLTQHQVENLTSLMSCLKEGTQARKTASTLQNHTSSRSHALLTLSLEFGNSSSGDAVSWALEKSQKKSHLSSPRCKLHLVDLAGSEKSTACVGINRLKEGANINKSLVALGNVISALAERSCTSHVLGKRFIPYRDSTLTWLLKDSFGGNATTIMLTTISPASGSYNETAHTLRFAQRAQSVINKPVISEDPVSKIIRELQEEISRLKAQLLEKNADSISNCQKLCTCHHNEASVYPEANLSSQHLSPSAFSTNKFKFHANLSPTVILRRHSYDDRLTSRYTIPNTLKKIGSLESIPDLKNTDVRKKCKFNKAEFSQTADGEFGETPFVDIPTLVAVLINPDANVPEDSHQLDEISSNSPHADQIAKRTLSNTYTNNLIPAKSDELFGEFSHLPIEKIDNSKNFTIVEISQKHKSRQFSGQTNEEPDLELNTFKNIDKLSNEFSSLLKKVHGTKENDKECTKSFVIRECNDKENKAIGENHDASTIKKQLPDTTERKTSVGSGSTSSKDECNATTGAPKNTRRNSSDPEQLSQRQCTPIQRLRRADIVAAVTERLYSSKKSLEEGNTASVPASDIKSPENTEAKFAPVTRMRLREISRKMLAKRRRVCADTQTDNCPTVRVRDAGIIAQEPKISQKDVSILTDRHEDFESISPCMTPVLRLKEMATSTSDFPSLQPITLLKDASIITENNNNDVNGFVPCCIDNVTNGSTSEISTNTNPLEEPKNMCIQTAHLNTLVKEQHTCCEAKNPCDPKNCQTETLSQSYNKNVPYCSKIPTITRCTHSPTHVIDHTNCHKKNDECCQCAPKSDEKNVISVSVPNMISITIQSSSELESKLQIFDNNNECKQKDEKNIQTEDKVFTSVETSTEDCDVRKTNIRESWTNTRLIDQYTNTEILQFSKLSDSHGSCSATSRINTLSEVGNDDNIDLDNGGISLKKDEEKNIYQPDEILLCNSLKKNNELLTKDWLTNNRQNWISHNCNNSCKHLINTSRNKYIFLNCRNLDNFAESKFTTRARNVFRHYSWRNVRNTKFNNLDKKLRHWNRLNFTNQIRNIQKKALDLTWTDKNLHYPKTIQPSCNKSNANLLDDNLASKRIKPQCLENTIKTLDIINGIKNGVKRTENIPDLVISKKNDLIDIVDSSQFRARFFSLDDFNDEYIGLPEKKLKNCTEIAATMHELKPHLSNLFLIPIIFSASDITNIKTDKSLNETKKLLGKNGFKPMIPSNTNSDQITSQEMFNFGNKKLSKEDFNVDNFKSTNSMNSTISEVAELTKSRNLIKDYLKETIMFMRNINFVSEINSDNKTQILGTCKSEKLRDKHLSEDKNDVLRNRLKKSGAVERNIINRKFCSYFDDNNTGNDDQLFDVTDSNLQLKFGNSAIKKLFNSEVLNNYLRLRNGNPNRVRRRRQSEFSSTDKNTNAENSHRQIVNNDNDHELNEINSSVYPKITENEETLMARGSKLSSPSRFTIPKYDSANENSSTNENFANFIETIQHNYRYKSKLRVSASPRLRLLQLMSERRQIIERSRNTVLP